MIWKLYSVYILYILFSKFLQTFCYVNVSHKKSYFILNKGLKIEIEDVTAISYFG